MLGFHAAACRFHAGRPAEDRCVRCGEFICQTCTTYRDELPLCPTCLTGPTAILRDLEAEAHLQAVGLLDFAAAGGAAFAGAKLALDGLWWPAGVILLAAALALLVVGMGVRAYLYPAAWAQSAVCVASLASPLLVERLRDLGPALSLAFVGGFGLWALFNERGRECFTSYYREAVAAGPTDEPETSILLILAMVLAALQAGLQLVLAA